MNININELLSLVAKELPEMLNETVTSDYIENESDLAKFEHEGLELTFYIGVRQEAKE